ncbi:MAG TPA: serine hydrolase domain-containing protein, partial [Candidatus Dormibacteraeota bacterium]|nr:serine hydrolase domain-containing protein [Candidatus Dormibacteraeota bacterium]
MDSAGFDGGRLERITDHLMERYVRPGKIAGCQALVARRGHVAYSRSFGCADLERGLPVRDDTVWRIYSMTKPITSVALMTLYERARFQLTDPVHRYIPEWKGIQVCEVEGDRTRLVEPLRPPSVRDVLTHTAGLSYGGDPSHPVDQAYAEAGLRDADIGLDELARRLGALPLKFHPGTRWHYSFATDVCARLVEVIADRPFGDYLRETIFDPLGMDDTGFTVPEHARDRFAVNYRRAEDGTLRVEPDSPNRPYLRPHAMQSGGGGLVSTTPDYLRFCEMVRRGGELDGHRVLGSRTVRYMTRSHLPGGAVLSDIALGAFGETGFAGVGFGLGFAIALDSSATQVIGSPGEFYWGGAASTAFWIDPSEELFVVFLTQLMPSSTYPFRAQLRSLVYA